jgi:uncharacterized protein YraI
MRLGSKCLALSAAALVIVAAGGMTSPADARTLCIGKESVLLRAGPSWRQDPVGSLPAGTCGVEVVSKCQSGWCEVAHGGRRGWVDSRLVIVREGSGAPASQKEAEPAPAPSPQPKRQAAPPPAPARPAPPPSATASTPQRDTHCVMGVHRGDTLRIRVGPSADHREIGGIPHDACGVIVGSPCSGSWCPVTYRGLKGWSNATYLRPPWMQ